MVVCHFAKVFGGKVKKGAKTTTTSVRLIIFEMCQGSVGKNDNSNYNQGNELHFKYRDMRVAVYFNNVLVIVCITRY